MKKNAILIILDSELTNSTEQHGGMTSGKNSIESHRVPHTATKYFSSFTCYSFCYTHCTDTPGLLHNK